MSMLYEKRGRIYKERPDLVPLTAFDPHMLLIAATRYYMGRMTIAACHFAQYELPAAWPDMRTGTKNVIRRDLESAFESDDDARARGQDYLPLGMDCDRKAWEAVRQAWGAEPLAVPQRQPMGQKDLARNARFLASQMAELAEDMQPHGGVIAEHGTQLAGAARIMRGLYAENGPLRHKLQTLEELGDAGDDVQLLRMGCAAARLEIASLQAQLEAVGAGGVGRLVPDVSLINEGDMADGALANEGTMPAAPAQPVAYIEHHKAGDNLQWEQPSGKWSALYTAPQPPAQAQDACKKAGAIAVSAAKTNSRDIADWREDMDRIAAIAAQQGAKP